MNLCKHALREEGANTPLSRHHLSESRPPAPLPPSLKSRQRLFLIPSFGVGKQCLTSSLKIESLGVGEEALSLLHGAGEERSCLALRYGVAAPGWIGGDKGAEEGDKFVVTIF